MGIVTLTPELIRNIYKRIEDGETQKSISNYYKVSRGHISKIKAGMSENPPEHARWSHLYIDYLERKNRSLL